MVYDSCLLVLLKRFAVSSGGLLFVFVFVYVAIFGRWL